MPDDACESVIAWVYNDSELALVGESPLDIMRCVNLVIHNDRIPIYNH